MFCNAIFFLEKVFEGLDVRFKFFVQTKGSYTLVYIANFIANKKGLTAVNVVSPCKTLIVKCLFEREKGFEPSTLSLGS